MIGIEKKLEEIRKLCHRIDSLEIEIENIKKEVAEDNSLRLLEYRKALGRLSHYLKELLLN